MRLFFLFFRKEEEQSEHPHSAAALPHKSKTKTNCVSYIIKINNEDPPTKMKKPSNQIFVLVATLAPSFGFHVVAPQKSRAVSTTLVHAESSSEMNLSTGEPFQNTDVDMDRARECAEHFGRCSTKEMRKLRDGKIVVSQQAGRPHHISLRFLILVALVLLLYSPPFYRFASRTHPSFSFWRPFGGDYCGARRNVRASYD